LSDRGRFAAQDLQVPGALYIAAAQDHRDVFVHHALPILQQRR
jgi:hypothetical protein